MAAKKKSKQTRWTLNPDGQGLLYFTAAFFIFVSLYSFSYLHPGKNWLGFFGYFIALSIEYLFGLGSLFIPCYLGWIGVRKLSWKKLPHLIYDHVYFFIFLSSVCFLLTTIAEKFPLYAASFDERVISETLIVSSPYHRTIMRHNLGGIPFYFLYADLPGLNLHNFLSATGCGVIFSSLGLVSFFLLTRIRFAQGATAAWKLGRKLIDLMAKFLQVVFKKGAKKKPSLKNQPELSEFPQKFFKINPPTPKKVSLGEEEVKKKNQNLKVPKINEPIVKQEIYPFLNRVNAESPPIPTKNLTVRVDSSFKLPSPNLLSSPVNKIDPPALKKDLIQQASVLEETLRSFGIEAKVGEINSGPTITSFEVHPSVGVKVQKIKTLENDIALNMQAKSIRIVAPIPGKAAIGVEVPTIHPQEVNFKEMLLHYQQKSKKLAIPILLGKAVNGDWVFADLTKAPHMLIAGATGSGKSVCINTIVISILMNSRPESVKLLMIDPKKVELTQYSHLPHMIAPVITEPHGAYAALKWLVTEMQVRYEILKQLGLRNIEAFNNRKINKELEAEITVPIPEQMPLIVAIVDEFADLMMVSSNDIETPIARIAQMARAVGIHLILATQRPSREVITGIIKANIPTRISFKVASRVNSQIVLDDIGAESLLGNGDLLFLPPGTSQLLRAQGAYLRDEDINQVVKYICSQGAPQYLIPSFDSLRSSEFSGDSSESKGKDLLYDQALTTILGSKSASTTFLQRKLKIGYARAASLMDELEENGVIGPPEGAKPRRVLIGSQMNSMLNEQENVENS